MIRRKECSLFTAAVAKDCKQNHRWIHCNEMMVGVSSSKVNLGKWDTRRESALQGYYWNGPGRQLTSASAQTYQYLTNKCPKLWQIGKHYNDWSRERSHPNDYAQRHLHIMIALKSPQRWPLKLSSPHFNRLSRSCKYFKILNFKMKTYDYFPSSCVKLYHNSGCPAQREGSNQTTLMEWNGTISFSGQNNT